MKIKLTGALLMCLIAGLHASIPDGVSVNDTIKTYNLNEVVVTSSTKETNNLRHLPGSASLITPQMISERRIDGIKDISALVPNLYIPDYGAKLTSAIYIRGIGARSSGQSIGVYVDNAPYLDKSTFDFELSDIQRIEILRGPQGTLYGRNAMGGIINIYTLSPFDYQGLKFSASYGSYGAFKSKASYYVKAGEKVGLAINAFYSGHKGYFTNVSTGRKADPEDTFGGSLKVEYRISPKINASYSLSAENTSQGAFPYGLYHESTGKVDPVNLGDTSTYNRFMITNNLHIEYKAPSFTFSSTTGYQYFNDDMKMDQDFSPKNIFILNQRQRQKAWSEEIALKSHTSGIYQWSFGLYGFHNSLHTDGPVTFKEDGVKDILQKVFDNLKDANPRMPAIKVMDNKIYIPGSFETPAYGGAVFHQSTINNFIHKNLSLTAGLRLDYERQSMDYTSEAIMNLGLVRTEGAPPTPIPGIKPTVMDASVSQKFLQVLPKASLKYNFTDRSFAYFSLAKGYKAGGYNVQMSADLMQTQMQYETMMQFSPTLAVKPESIEKVTSYKPEHSLSYEAGFRSDFMDNRLTTELTLYYMDISDIQITKFVESGNGRILANAGKAESYGAEISLRAKISSELSADLNYGFTRATFRDYIYEQKVNSQIVQTDCKGYYLPYIPHHTLNIGLHYSKLFRNSFIDQFTVSAQFSGAGRIYWTELNDIEQPFYGLLNLKAGVRKDKLRFNIWGRNLTDTDYSAFYFESFGNRFIQKGKPLQFGVEAAFVF